MPTYGELFRKSTSAAELTRILDRHGRELPPDLIASKGLTHKDPGARRAAVAALWSLGPKAAGAVVELLAHENPLVRRDALWALGSFGRKAAEYAEKPLLRLFSVEKTSSIAMRAARAMGLEFKRVGREIRLQ